MSRQPEYNFRNFIGACKYGVEKVKVRRKAVKTARNDFNLNTQHQVVQFIGNNGLQRPKLINCEPLREPPCPIVMVDAYSFYSGSIYGYLAFYYQMGDEVWVIKSFKKNEPRKSLKII